jgi:hypothetical protein
LTVGAARLLSAKKGTIAMTKWEYKFATIEMHVSPVLTMARWGIQLKGDKRVRMGEEPVEAYVNELGKEGWELACGMQGSDRDGKITKAVLVFKRPLPA